MANGGGGLHMKVFNSKHVTISEQVGSSRTGRRSDPLPCSIRLEHEHLTMKDISVHPSNDIVADTNNAEHGSHDNTDGPDVFSKEVFSPLLNSNQYQVRKLAAQALMDVALMMANISQLRTILSLGSSRSMNFYPMVAMVSFSLMCQVVFAIFMFAILMRETDQQQKRDYLDNIRMMEENGVPLEKTAKMRQSVKSETNDFRYQRTTGHLNFATMILVFLITVSNMFITGFGIKEVREG